MCILLITLLKCDKPQKANKSTAFWRVLRDVHVALCRTYHDSWEVHAGDSIHDDEDPGVRQIVEAVIKTNWKKQREGNCWAVCLICIKDGVTMQSKPVVTRCFCRVYTRLGTWRPAAGGQNSTRTRSWAGAQRRRRWWECCSWHRRGQAGSRNDRSMERSYLRETHFWSVMAQRKTTPSQYLKKGKEKVWKEWSNAFRKVFYLTTLLPVSMRTAPTDNRRKPTREMTLLNSTSNCCALSLLRR